MSDSTTTQEPQIDLLDKIFFWTGMIFAVWIILAVSLFDLNSAALFWSNIGSGTLLLALGVVIFRRYRTEKPIRGTVLFIKFLLGVWIVSSPVLFDALAAPISLITWTNVLPGLVIALLAGVEALLRFR